MYYVLSVCVLCCQLTSSNIIKKIHEFTYSRSEITRQLPHVLYLATTGALRMIVACVSSFACFTLDLMNLDATRVSTIVQSYFLVIVLALSTSQL